MSNERLWRQRKWYLHWSINDNGHLLAEIIKCRWVKLLTQRHFYKEFIALVLCIFLAFLTEQICTQNIAACITRMHTESAYICQVHNNVMMYTTTHLHVYIHTSLVMYVCSRRLPTIMTSSIITVCSGMCGKSIGNGVNIFVHCSSTPTSILNLTIPPESQYNGVSNDISSVWKHSQHFTHESNTFLAKIRYSAYYVITLPRVTACCCMQRSQNIGWTQCTFLYISPQTPFRFWTWLRRQKAKKRRFQWCIVRIEIFLTFHARVEYISVKTVILSGK